MLMIKFRKKNKKQKKKKKQKKTFTKFMIPSDLFKTFCSYLDGYSGRNETRFHRK